MIYKLKKKVNVDFDGIEYTSLDELFFYYGTDKSEYSKDKKNKTHGFSKYYEKHLSFLKKRKIKILEIGSFSGASAAAFSKYFPNCEIYCLDINISNFKYYSKKIHVFGLDSSNSKMVSKFFKKINDKDTLKYFDVIIDDGSHKQSDQLSALNHFYEYLVDGGFYVIEDYKFPNYFKHLNDVNDIKIDELVDYILKKKSFSSSLVSSKVTNLLLDTINNVYKYKGNTDISDIVFFEKN
mgnify:CR=1 FL=1